MTPTRTLRTVHIIPRGDHWVLMSPGRDEAGLLFTDLGRALDAATGGESQVHVVVHERPVAECPVTMDEAAKL